MAKKDLKKPKFTPQQMLFIDNYILDKNVKFTAQRTGLGVQQCYYIKSLKKVKDEIDRRCTDIAERCDLSAEMVLNELKRIAFYDVKDHIKNIRTNVPENIKDKKKQKEEQEHFIELEDFEKLDGRAIAEITEKIGKYGLPEIKIKAHSKMEALKVLADWFKGGHGDAVTNVQININELKDKSAQEVATEYMNIINGA